MSTEHPESKTPSKLEAIRESLEFGALKNARLLLKGLRPAEIAHLIESLPPARRQILWEMADPEDYGEVLLHLGEDLRVDLIEETSPDALLAAAEGMEIDDLAELLSDLPDAVIQATLEGMDKQYRQRLEAVLAYPDDTAGRL